MLAMVDLPEPDRPVNHRITGFCPAEIVLKKLGVTQGGCCSQPKTKD